MRKPRGRYKQYRPDRDYMTKMVRNLTNFSFTVPSAIVGTSGARKRDPFLWTDEKEPGKLMLVPFAGTIKQAEKRAREKGDVVFLQRMERKGSQNSQFKINLPSWIMEDMRLDQQDDVKMSWSLTKTKRINGRISLGESLC